MQASIKREFGLTADLTMGHGGVFDVAVDGTTVYSKDRTNRFPTDEEIFAQVRALKR